MRRIILHAGFHKTGTTSIQRFLQQHRSRLQKVGIDFYAGKYIDNNHVELHAAAMRDERMSGFKVSTGFKSSAMFDEIRNLVGKSIEEAPRPAVLFSAEGLSYLRFEDEMDRLKAILGDRSTMVVFHRRNLVDWTASFKYQLALDGSFSKDPDAFNYVEPDSWLFDIDARLQTFQRAFGEENVIVLDYDAEVARARSVIPSFLSVIGADDVFPSETWNDIWENKRPAA